MDNKLVFEELKSNIMAIEEVQLPTIPMNVFNDEAELLAGWIIKDREALVARGLKVRYLDSLRKRVDASRYAQSVWNSERDAQEAAQLEWKEQSPIAYTLRDNLVHEMEFAYFQNPNLMNALDRIKQGSGHADMIQDLSDLAVLGRENPEPLKTTKFDTTLLDKAINMADSIAEVRSIANGENAESSESKVMRDKAFTFLKEAVDEIRRVGRFVFRNDPARLEGYQLTYLNTHR